jgi:TPR repeat protein
MFGAVMTAAPVHSTTQCDQLGALQADPMAVSAPVAFDAIDANALISACTFALQGDNSDRARYLLQRARGYLRAGRGDQAMLDIRAAHELDYPAATFALATAYFLGDDVPQDFEQARVLYENSYEQGVNWSAKGLSMLYENEFFEGYDPAKSANWLTKFER